MDITDITILNGCLSLFATTAVIALATSVAKNRRWYDLSYFSRLGFVDQVLTYHLYLTKNRIEKIALILWAILPLAVHMIATVLSTGYDAVQVYRIPDNAEAMSAIKIGKGFNLETSNFEFLDERFVQISRDEYLTGLMSDVYHISPNQTTIIVTKPVKNTALILNEESSQIRTQSTLITAANNILQMSTNITQKYSDQRGTFGAAAEFDFDVSRTLTDTIGDTVHVMDTNLNSYAMFSDAVPINYYSNNARVFSYTRHQYVILASNRTNKIMKIDYNISTENTGIKMENTVQYSCAPLRCSMIVTSQRGLITRYNYRFDYVADTKVTKYIISGPLFYLESSLLSNESYATIPASMSSRVNAAVDAIQKSIADRPDLYINERVGYIAVGTIKVPVKNPAVITTIVLVCVFATITMAANVYNLRGLYARDLRSILISQDHNTCVSHASKAVRAKFERTEESHIELVLVRDCDPGYTEDDALRKAGDRGKKSKNKNKKNNKPQNTRAAPDVPLPTVDDVMKGGYKVVFAYINENMNVAALRKVAGKDYCVGAALERIELDAPDDIINQDVFDLGRADKADIEDAKEHAVEVASSDTFSGLNVLQRLIHSYICLVVTVSMFDQKRYLCAMLGTLVRDGDQLAEKLVSSDVALEFVNTVKAAVCQPRDIERISPSGSHVEVNSHIKNKTHVSFPASCTQKKVLFMPVRKPTTIEEIQELDCNAAVAGEEVLLCDDESILGGTAVVSVSELQRLTIIDKTRWRLGQLYVRPVEKISEHLVISDRDGRVGTMQARRSRKGRETHRKRRYFAPTKLVSLGDQRRKCTSTTPALVSVHGKGSRTLVYATYTIIRVFWKRKPQLKRRVRLRT